jgi:hypothetical protein
MDGTRSAEESAMPDEGSEFDPREAARVLKEATSKARRSFDLKRPLLWVFAGTVVLLAYGALWFSVRHQHPYQGPSLGTIAAVYVAIVVGIALSARLLQRATKDVSGPSRVLTAGEGIAIVLAYIATAVIQGALHDAGASHAIVYGIFPAAAPLVIVGCTLAGITGTKQDWPMFAVALAVVSVGTAGLLVSPAASWAVVGIGVFGITVVFAIAKAWVQHHKLVLA